MVMKREQILARVIIRVRLGMATEEERELLGKWLDEEVANRRLYRNIIRGKSIAGRLRLEDEINQTTDFQKVYEEVARRLAVHRSRRYSLRRIVVVSGAIASCLVGIFVALHPLVKVEVHKSMSVQGELKEMKIVKEKVMLVLGNGDFRSKEVTKLRDEADFIVTNPPFSLFREFLAWIIEADKKFIIIGNMNAITYKEAFPLIKDNKMWLGYSIHSGDREFEVPNEYPLAAAGWRIDENGRKFIRVKGVRWFTNIDHGRRHQPLALMTMVDNLRFSKHKELKGKTAYDHYDNYDAIEVPFTDAIPSDYDGVMGVPISFLDKYCPEQFEILGITDRGNQWGLKTKEYNISDTPNFADLNRRGAIGSNGSLVSTYARLLIRKL